MRLRTSMFIFSALVVGACGDSSHSSGSSRGGATAAAGTEPAAVTACLEGRGYGVTEVPKSDLAEGGAENRGPGQTGELLVGMNGARPRVGADDAAAVVAFWDSHAHASGSPNASDSRLGSHADTIGAMTVQPTVQLALSAARSAGSPNARRQAYDAATKRIEQCVG